jgi:hypothetical protein
VKPFQAWRDLGTTVVPSSVLAQTGDEVVYYDDVEEEFGTASLDRATLRLRNEGTWGEPLEWALRHFRRRRGRLRSPSGYAREPVRFAVHVMLDADTATCFVALRALWRAQGSPPR